MIRVVTESVGEYTWLNYCDCSISLVHRGYFARDLSLKHWQVEKRTDGRIYLLRTDTAILGHSRNSVDGAKYLYITVMLSACQPPIHKGA